MMDGDSPQELHGVVAEPDQTGGGFADESKRGDEQIVDGLTREGLLAKFATQLAQVGVAFRPELIVLLKDLPDEASVSAELGRLPSTNILKGRQIRAINLGGAFVQGHE